MNRFNLTRFNSNLRTALVLACVTAASAVRAEDDPLTAALGGVNLAGAAAAIGALVLLIIGIAMAFKGADVGKRAVRKV